MGIPHTIYHYFPVFYIQEIEYLLLRHKEENNRFLYCGEKCAAFRGILQQMRGIYWCLCKLNQGGFSNLVSTCNWYLFPQRSHAVKTRAFDLCPWRKRQPASKYRRPPPTRTLRVLSADGPSMCILTIFVKGHTFKVGLFLSKFFRICFWLRLWFLLRTQMV